MEIPLDKEIIGELMLNHATSIGRKTGVKRSLISSMQGKDMVIFTTLLQEYIKMGLNAAMLIGF